MVAPALEYVPDSQEVHVVAPAAEKLPAEQSVHSEAPALMRTGGMRARERYRYRTHAGTQGAREEQY